MAAGIAAHEAGHAIQAARGFRLLAIREVAVPAAVFGSGAGILVAVVGLIVRFPPFLASGILLFGGVLVVQLVNLPVELHASRCARRMLVQLRIIPDEAAVPRVDGVACGGIDLRGRDSAIGADVDPVRGRWVRAAS